MLHAITLPPRNDLPYLAQYLGTWNMVPHVLDEAFDRVARIDLVAHLQQREQQQQTRSAAAGGNDPQQKSIYPYQVSDAGVAVIDVVGTLMKQESSLGESTSTVMLRRTLRAAQRDPEVRGIMLRIDSPGGTTAGTDELGDDVFAATKPLRAYVEGLGASAAYWIASQADEISAAPTSMVGSIGTYMAVRDTSRAAKDAGVKVHLIRSSEIKGAGYPGTKITAEQVGQWQKTIDDTQSVFTDRVARGRGISRQAAEKLADARVHVGQAALAAGLIDHVESFEQAIARMESDLSPAAPQQAPNMPARKRASTAAARLEAAAAGGETQSNETAGGCSAGEPTAGPQSQAPQPPAESHPSPPPAATSSEATTQETSMSQNQGATAPTQAPTPNASETSQATQQAGAKPATVAELKAACPGASADFILEQAEKGATLPAAKDAFVGFQAAQIRARDEELTKLRATSAAKFEMIQGVSNATPASNAAGAPAAKPGVPPLRTAAAARANDPANPAGAAYGSSDAADEFKSLVDAKLEANKSKAKYSRMDAVAAVARENPDLQARYIEENQNVLRK